MSTSTQRKFRKEMQSIQKEHSKKSKGKFYSYIMDKHISSYYEGSPKLKRRYRFVRIFKNSFLLVAVIFTALLFLAAPYSKITAIPFTVMIASLILLVFGLIHPSLAFMNGKSRLRVILVYGALAVIGFVVTGITLGA